MKLSSANNKKNWVWVVAYFNSYIMFLWEMLSDKEQIIKIKVLPIYMYYQYLFCEVLHFTPGVPWKSKIGWKTGLSTLLYN